MKKLIFSLTLLFTGMVNAGCDFSKVKLQQWNQGTYYKWYLSGWERDTCKNFMFMIYDFQKKKTDTIVDSRGIIEIGFNAPGEYKMYVKVWDKCNKCDTVIYRSVKIIGWKPTANLKSIKKTCDSAWFEMSSMNMKDTCWTNYYYVYSGPELESLTEKEFTTMSDYDLYMYYSFDEKDIQVYTQARLLKYKFPKDGNYLIVGQYINKCLGQDTFFFNRTIINCKTSDVTNFTKADAKLIGVYDVLGRPVTEIKNEELYIYIYNDGSTRKIIKK